MKTDLSSKTLLTRIVLNSIFVGISVGFLIDSLLVSPKHALVPLLALLCFTFSLRSYCEELTRRFK